MLLAVCIGKLQSPYCELGHIIQLFSHLNRHVVYNVLVSCKANGDRYQLGTMLDNDPKAD